MAADTRTYTLNSEQRDQAVRSLLAALDDHLDAARESLAGTGDSLDRTTRVHGIDVVAHMDRANAVLAALRALGWPERTESDG